MHREQPANSVMMIQAMRFNSDLSALHLEPGDGPAALSTATAGRHYAQLLLDADPVDAGTRRNHATQQQARALALAAVDRGDEAREEIELARATLAELAGNNPDDVSLQRDFALVLRDAAGLQVPVDVAAACKHARQARAIGEAQRRAGTPLPDESLMAAFSEAAARYCERR